jgi:hypothetical protein
MMSLPTLLNSDDPQYKEVSKCFQEDKSSVCAVKVKWVEKFNVPCRLSGCIKNPMNEGLPIKFSRDCQEIPYAQAVQLQKLNSDNTNHQENSLPIYQNTTNIKPTSEDDDEIIVCKSPTEISENSHKIPILLKKEERLSTLSSIVEDSLSLTDSSSKLDEFSAIMRKKSDSIEGNIEGVKRQ